MPYLSFIVKMYKVIEPTELDEINKFFKNKNSSSIIELVVKKLFKNNAAYVCSFGSESSIILHMISKIDCNFPVVFLNTNKLFNETILYKNKLLRQFKLKNILEVFLDVSARPDCYRKIFNSYHRGRQ